MTLRPITLFAGTFLPSPRFSEAGTSCSHSALCGKRENVSGEIACRGRKSNPLKDKSSASLGY